MRSDQAILFVHVPKTGGGAVGRWFQRAGYRRSDYDGSRFTPTDSNYYRTVSPQHWHAEILAQVYRLERIRASLMFSRHPLKRLLSEYRWQRQNFTRSQRAKRFPPLEEWWETVQELYQKDKSCFDNHIRPQVDFILPGTVVAEFDIDLSSRFLNDFLGNAGFQQSRARFPTVHKSVEGARATRGSLGGGGRRFEKEVEEFYAEDFAYFNYPHE